MTRRSGRRHTPRTARGFVTLVAVVLLALAATALVLVSALVGADARRSGHERVDAQLRLLLLAGALNASAAAPGAPQGIATPLDGATLTRSVSDVAGERIVKVVATFAGRRAEQTQRFRRQGDDWVQVGATLVPPRPEAAR